MRIPRIYLPAELSEVLASMTITGTKAHYIKNVLRLKINHKIHFFIPAGIEYEALITTVSKHQVVLSDIQAISQPPPASKLTTCLIQGISSSDRMDYSIQKAAELGCTQLTPVTTDFCSHRIAAHKMDKKQQHWQAVAISACEQSGRVDIMQVQPISGLTDVLENVQQAIYLEPNANHFLNQLPAEYQRQQTIIIGPEGGFSPTELDYFVSRKYIGVQMGPRVLRTETVAPTVLGALHALYGDFKAADE